MGTWPAPPTLRRRQSGRRSWQADWAPSRCHGDHAPILQQSGVTDRGKRTDSRTVQSVAASRKLFSRRFIQFLIHALSLAAKHSAGSSFHLVFVDPLYVDAAIRRWQHLTKRDAVLAGTNGTFDEMAAARATTKGRKLK